MSSPKLLRVAFAYLGGPVAHESLNTLLSCIVLALNGKAEVIGLSGGLHPLLNGSTEGVIPLSVDDLKNPEEMGQCLLVTERELPRRRELEWDRAVEILCDELHIDVLIVSGGDGSFIAMKSLADASRGRLRIIIIPRTMDGDFVKSEYDIGFDSALQNAIRTLKGHHGECSTYGRPSVVQIMGRDTGIFTLHCAKAVNARMCLIPEEFTLGTVEREDLLDALVAQTLVSLVESNKDRKRRHFSEILVAEGFWRALTPESQDRLKMVRKGAEQHGRIDYAASPPIGSILAEAMTLRFRSLNVRRLEVDVSANFRVIGHNERQGPQSKKDKELAIAQGSWAAELALSGDSSIPDTVVALPGKYWKPFTNIKLIDGGDRIEQPLKLVGPTLFRDTVDKQSWLTEAHLNDELMLADLASYTSLSPVDFKRRFEKAAQFFSKRRPVATA